MNKYCILLFFCFLFSVSALWGQQKATPKPGEGISTFLLRHNRAPKKYYDDFIKLNEAKLGKGQTLKLGVTYLIPPVKKKGSGFCNDCRKRCQERKYRKKTTAPEDGKK